MESHDFPYLQKKTFHISSLGITNVLVFNFYVCVSERRAYPKIMGQVCLYGKFIKKN